MAAFGNIQTPAMKREPVHRRAQVLNQQLALRAHTPNTAARRRTTEWQTRLSHVHSTSVVEREACRKRKPASYCFNLILCFLCLFVAHVIGAPAASHASSTFLLSRDMSRVTGM